MIRITDRISIDERELEEQFVRASGPGGQNVNKVSTAVELRFVLDGLSALPEDVKARLAGLAGRRLTLDGVIVIRSDSHRTQERNRAEALARLVELVERATHRPKPRHKTKVPRAERQRPPPEPLRVLVLSAHAGAGEPVPGLGTSWAEGPIPQPGGRSHNRATG